WHSLGSEAGTDNSLNYWTQDSGSWSFASHLVTSPAAVAIMHAGHADWGDCVYTVRTKWVTGSFNEALIHFTNTTNWVSVAVDGVNVYLRKNVAGVISTVAQSASALTNGNFYWIQVSGTGTSYSVASYNDSAGALTTVINTA